MFLRRKWSRRLPKHIYYFSPSDCGIWWGVSKKYLNCKFVCFFTGQTHSVIATQSFLTALPHLSSKHEVNFKFLLLLFYFQYSVVIFWRIFLFYKFVSCHLSILNSSFCFWFLCSYTDITLVKFWNLQQMGVERENLYFTNISGWKGLTVLQSNILLFSSSSLRITSLRS